MITFPFKTALSMKLIGAIMMMTVSTNAGPVINLRPPEHYFHKANTIHLLNAALTGNEVEAKACVVKGADPNDEGPIRNEKYRLRLLHYAIAAKNPAAVRTLLDVGADPELNALGYGEALLFVITLKDLEMMSLLLDIHPIITLRRDTVKEMMFVSAMEDCIPCLDLLLNRGVPIDYPDDAEYTVMMRAMDAEDYDMAQWLVERGASVQVEAYNGVTPAYAVEFHLSHFKVGTPTYFKVLRLKELMQERGAVFPPPTPAEVRAKRGIKDDPVLYPTSSRP